MKNHRPLEPYHLLLASIALSGCGGGGGSSSPGVPVGAFRSPVTRTLTTFTDPWASSSQRYWDIDDRPITALKPYSYASATVNLTYDSKPTTPYFRGRLVATGLKPNFSYQLKLAGKPKDGTRGWGAAGDDLTNERIGTIGRWWDDEGQSNQTDAYYNTAYKSKPAGSRTTVYGYQLMGIAVTDSHGNADVAFNGSGSFHVTWQDKQDFGKDFDAGTYSIGTSPPYYGYGHAVPTENIKLWMEREPGRPVSVRLPAGHYNCRFVLTEDSFHNNFGGTTSPDGGFWQTVLANEDFAGGAPDNAPGNDIVFDIT